MVEFTGMDKDTDGGTSVDVGQSTNTGAGAGAGAGAGTNTDIKMAKSSIIKLPTELLVHITRYIPRSLLGTWISMNRRIGLVIMDNQVFRIFPWNMKIFMGAALRDRRTKSKVLSILKKLNPLIGSFVMEELYKGSVEDKKELVKRLRVFSEYNMYELLIKAMIMRMKRGEEIDEQVGESIINLCSIPPNQWILGTNIWKELWKTIGKGGKVEYLRQMIKLDLGLDMDEIVNIKEIILIEASKYGCIDLIKYLIEESKTKCPANVRNSMALIEAASGGYLKVVRYLMESPRALPRCKANASNSLALRKAAENGHFLIVRYMMESPHALPRCEVDSRDSWALRWAASSGHIEIVRYLMESPIALPRCEANVDDSASLRKAASNGHIGVVRYLMESPWALPRCSANALSSEALKLAADGGHFLVVKYLMESPLALPRCSANANN
jgi:Ankyrin repeats (3 copies)